MHEEELKKIGLTDGEARVYLALLNLNSSTVGPIAKKSKVAYSKIYEVLERLLEKGLVSYITKEKTKYFQALEPGRLNEYIEKKKIELEKNEKDLENLIPLLKSHLNKETAREAEIFVGENGLMTAHEILLEKAKEKSKLRFFYIFNPEYDERVYDFFYGRLNFNGKKTIPMLKQKKMKWLGIINGENIKKKFKKYPKLIVQRRANFPIPGNIDITDNSVLIAVWSDDPMGILIQSEETAKNFKDYFDSVWKIAK
ncbi:helix-turn-helix domain-containing protein [Candidatus Pacearchaeota archaeon]|nr:helix-turn-helix domain-containing protein [Candidatus Pacearchaeota archaeon]